MTRFSDLDRTFRNATDEELERWRKYGVIQLEPQEYSPEREGFLSRYEGPIFVAAFIAACLGFLGWLMLSDGWKAVIFWCAIVALCLGMIAWKIIRDRS